MNRREIFLVLLAAILFCFAVSFASGDQVVTSDRVTTSVNVRENLITGSPSVGKLMPGQTAELLESIPYWYHIRLSSGVQGYVSALISN